MSPPGPALFAPLGQVATPGPRLEVSQISPAPVGARPGRAYTLAGVAMNSGTAVGERPAQRCNLLRVGVPPLPVGRTTISVGAHRSLAYRVRVALPRGLRHGAYMIVACMRRGGENARTRWAARAQSGTSRSGRPRMPECPGPPGGRRGARRARGRSRFPARTCIRTRATAATGASTPRSTVVYDAPSNRFLPGNHVVLTDRATQCLTDFSLDFERTSVLGPPAPT